MADARAAHGLAAKGPPDPNGAHSEEARAVADRFDVDVTRGLSQDEVARRLTHWGPNVLRAPRVISWWAVLGGQFKSLVVALLVAAIVVSFILGDLVEALAIGVLLVLNAAIGFTTEMRAVRSMEALRGLGGVVARVRRDGQTLTTSADDLVPGDVILVEGGDVLTADARILSASRLQCDESALTGESAPVSKSREPADPNAALPERRSMLHKGTIVARGSGEAVVVATGLATELGRITELVEEAAATETPLERRIEELGRGLVVLTLAITLAVGLVGIARGKDPTLMLETAVALAIAAVPEGLPVVATLTLARGMLRMARRNALVRRLSAVETLGSTSVLCVDKTGTLTENRMTVTGFALADGDVVVVPGEGTDHASFERDGRAAPVGDDRLLAEALEIGALCTNASLGPDPSKDSGDPLEVALLRAARRAGIAQGTLLERHPEAWEEAFDTEVKMMATGHARPDGGYRVAVKGAPEVVLGAATRVLTPEGEVALTDDARKTWIERNRAMAADGLRVLALATRTDEEAVREPYEALVLVGLVGLEDPPRADVRGAVLTARRAGVRVVMVTGDQPRTAQHIARATGIVDEDDPVVLEGTALAGTPGLEGVGAADVLRARILARVSPAQKLDVISVHQGAGAVVGMTGDGVNDAPALRKADIGIAMGQRGTQVAREAADIVLRDDAFATITAAIEEGRAIFTNLRKFVVYLLSCNVSEVLLVALAVGAGAPLPLLPLQILFLNLVTDVFPALALGAGEGEPGAMTQPPRPSGEPILTRRHWGTIAGFGLLLSLTTLSAFAAALLWLGSDPQEAVTISFLSIATSQLVHVFNLRSPNSPMFANEVTRNRLVWAALALCAVLLAVALGVPAVADVLQLSAPGPAGWAMVAMAAMATLLVGQTALVVAGRRARRQPEVQWDSPP